MIQIIPPKGDYITFDDGAHYEEKGKEWGLFNKTAKREFLYKEREELQTVTIAGYEIHGKHNTLVVKFPNGSLSCIHPAYLKEMQSPTFGKTDFQEIEMSEMEAASTGEKLTESKKVKKEVKKEVEAKVVLPEEKVKGTAIVEGFATKFNPFTESDDEIVLVKDLVLHLEEPLELGNGWCSYSKTLKKKELKEGMEIVFEAKVAAKKFDKETLYKINNPKLI